MSTSYLCILKGALNVLWKHLLWLHNESLHWMLSIFNDLLLVHAPLHSHSPLYGCTICGERNKHLQPSITALPEKSTYSVTEVFQSNSRGQAVITQHSRAFCGWPASLCPSKVCGLSCTSVLYRAIQTSAGRVDVQTQWCGVLWSVCVFVYFSSSLILQALPQPWSTHNNSSYGPYKDPPAFYPAHPQKVLIPVNNLGSVRFYSVFYFLIL